MDDSAARPKSLKFKEPVIDIAFSPTDSLVASSLITGHVFIHRYAVGGNERKQRLKVHKKSCRSVCFSGDGSSLYTASKDKSWQALDVATGGEQRRVEDAHDKAINIVKYVNEQIIATGDEAGGVKLWDVRQNKAAFAYSEHVDYISDMVFHAEKRHLLATSGDGCLSVYDVRKSKAFHVSENQDDELLSVALMRGGKKVVVGETDGVLGIFTYGQFDDVTDRFPGHPQSIDSICKLTEELCVTGSSDGLLRIVQLFPHKLVGVAGDHKSLPVEKVVLSHDQQWLASCSHDHTVHFWDIGYIFNEDENEEGDGGEVLDAQAMAIQVSKDVASEDADIDIDGLSDGSELRGHGETGLGADESSDDGSEDSEDGDDEVEAEVDVVASSAGSAGEEEEEEDEEEDEDEDGGEDSAEGASKKGEKAGSGTDGGDDSDGEGWGSWGDSDDDDKGARKKKKAPATKADKLKAKRAASAELARPDGKKRAASASFFADL